ncbi:MAG: hypothetical protein JEZ00_20045 [Anaerolineaceae bacterium]|nr:hypothetical protein [Anaerolineaceae bacterium]
MDPIKILKRSWHILWQYRALWIFGLILALTAGSSSGGNSNSNVQSDSFDYQKSSPMPDNIVDFFTQAGEEIEESILESVPPSIPIQEEWTGVMWTIIGFVLLMLVVGFGFTILRYVSETAVLRMVDEYEATDTKMSVRQGFRIGWSRTSWRLFLIDFLVSLPILLLLTALFVTGISVYAAYNTNPSFVADTTIFGIIIIAVLAIIGVVIIGIFLSLLRNFFWRVCALENVGVMESLRRGFSMVRQNWKSVGLMWLIMIGLGIAWAIVGMIAFFILIPVMILTAAVAAVIVSIPGLMFAGIFSLFLHGWLPWIMAGVFVLPLFVTLAFSPLTLLTAWQQIFTSSVWTLTYRELVALPVLIEDEVPQLAKE